MEFAVCKQTVLVDHPYGPYLDDATDERSPMTWMHQHRLPLIWGIAAALMLWRAYRGLLLDDMLGLLGAFGDFTIPLWLVSLIFIVSFESASIAINPRFSQGTALALHLTLQAVLTTVVAGVMSVYHLRVLSSLTLGCFWALMFMKTHSYFAWYRITNHAVVGMADMSTARLSPFSRSPVGQHPLKQQVSFIGFLPMPSFVYDAYPLRVRGGPRWRAALAELVACAGTVLLLHLMHITLTFPVLLEVPRIELNALWNHPLHASILFVKLMGPAHISFVVLFYGMWHCAATFAAEITCFADRTRFYGPFWREPLLGNYFRLWSALVHTWLRRHCIDDILGHPTLPLRAPRLHPLPPALGIPTKPSTPPADAAPVVPSTMPDRPRHAARSASPVGRGTAPPADGASRRARRRFWTRGKIAALTAYVVSAYIHEVVFFMTVHTMGWPTFVAALATLGLYVGLERRVGRALLPHSLIMLAVMVGHTILYAQVAYMVLDAHWPERAAAAAAQAALAAAQ